MKTKANHIGTAGWAVAAKNRAQFAEADSALARYASRFNAVEINSSFYRPHRAATYARWAQCVPQAFRFSVKLPKAITHQAKLCDADDAVQAFIDQVGGLGSKLGPILIQLPPKLEFSLQIAATFFAGLRELHGGQVVLEPRHASWFDAPAEHLLIEHRIARVAADPAKVPAAALPGGWEGMRYYRLHGSPRTYFSAYSDAYLEQLAVSIRSAKVETWVIFDNTAGGAAVDNALTLCERQSGSVTTRKPRIDRQ